MLMGDLRTEQEARTQRVAATSTIPIPAGLTPPAWWTADGDPAEANMRAARQAVEILQ